MRVSLKSVPGVDAAVVNLAKGVAAVKMKPGNTTTLKELNQAITKNGFTMKQSNATIAGVIVMANGKATLQISGSNETLELIPEAVSIARAESFPGKLVLVDGEIPEGSKGKPPNSIHYRSIKEGSSK